MPQRATSQLEKMDDIAPSTQPPGSNQTLRPTPRVDNRGRDENGSSSGGRRTSVIIDKHGREKSVKGRRPISLNSVGPIFTEKFKFKPNFISNESIHSPIKITYEDVDKEIEDLEIDEYGRAILKGNKKINILDARKIDMRLGGHHHRTATEILNNEYASMLITLKRQEEINVKNMGIDEHPENTGFWIFGAGHAFILPRSYADPIQKGKFISKVIFVYLLCLISRFIWLHQSILGATFHRSMYDREVYGYPLLIVLVLYLFVTGVATGKRIAKIARVTPITMVLFGTQETLRTIIYIFISLLYEYGIHAWYDTIDIFDEYHPSDPTDRNHWQKLNLTPPVFLIIAMAMIGVNIFVALCLEKYTDMSLGTPEMHRATIMSNLMTFIISSLLMKFYSVGVVPMWDGFQVIYATIQSIIKTWVFLYHLQRMVVGKVKPLQGMDWGDVLYCIIVIG